MAEPLTFTQFAEFVRERASIPKQKAITPETQFEREDVMQTLRYAAWLAEEREVVLATT